MTSQATATAERNIANSKSADLERQEKDTVADRLAHGRDQAERLYRRTKDRALELEGGFEEYVKERPLKSLLIATGVGAGLGLSIGALLARR